MTAALRLDFELDGAVLSDEFMVVPNLRSEVIIGTKTMQAWRIKVDIEKERMILELRLAALTVAHTVYRHTAPCKITVYQTFLVVFSGVAQAIGQFPSSPAISIYLILYEPQTGHLYLTHQEISKNLNLYADFLFSGSHYKTPKFVCFDFRQNLNYNLR